MAQEQVFISYAREDEAFATRLGDELRRVGRIPWKDTERLEGGQRVWSEIEVAIERASAFLFVISRHSMRSDYCAREAQHALDRRHFIVPILLAPFDEDDPKLTGAAREVWGLEAVPFDDPESFGSSVEQLNAALDKDWVDARNAAILRERSREWQEAEEEPRPALNEHELSRFKRWLASSVTAASRLDQPERDFIFASEQKIREDRDRFGRLFEDARRAEGLKRVSQLASSAVTMLEHTPQRAALLAVEALRLGYDYSATSTSDAVNAIYTVLRRVSGCRLGQLAEETTHARLSPDGRYLASVSRPGCLEVADLAAAQPEANIHELRRQTLVTHSSTRDVLCFSPDSKRLAVGGWIDGTIRLWDLEHHEECVLEGHSSIVSHLAFSPGGRHVVSLCAEGIGLHTTDRTAIVWTVDGEESGRWRFDEVGSIDDAFWSDSLDVLLLRGGAGACLADFADGSPTISPLGDGSVEMLGWLPGTAIFWTVRAVDDANVLELWEYRGGDSHSEERIRHIGALAEATVITHVRPGPRGRIAFGTREVPDDPGNTIWTADASADAPVACERLGGDPVEIASLHWSPESRWLLVTAQDRYPCLLDVEAGRDASGGTELRVHEPIAVHGVELSRDSDSGIGHRAEYMEYLRAVAFTPDESILVTGGVDGQVAMWELADRPALSTAVFVSAKHSSVGRLCVSPSGRYFASGGGAHPNTVQKDYRIYLYATEKPRESRLLLGHEGEIEELWFSADERWLVSQSDDDTLRLWDVEASTAAGELLRGPRSELSEAVVLNASEQAFSGNEAGILVHWDFAKAVVSTLDHVSGKISAIAAGPDATWIATTVLSSRDISLVRADSPAAAPRVLQRPGEDTVLALSWDPAGGCLASGDMVGGLCLHDVRRIDNVIGCWTIQLDLESVSCLAWDMTGRWLAAGCGFFMRRDDALSRGGNVYLFEKQPHSLELRLHRVFQGHEGEIRFLEFVASGQRLISASADGTLRVWNVTDPTGAAMVTDPNPNVDWRPGIVSVQMTADQRRLIAGLDDGIVLGWELDAGESLREAFRVRAHDGTVNAVAIEPQGRFFASGGHDTHVRLWAWDAPDDAIEIAVHDAPVKSLHVYGDGQIVSFSDAGHCRIDPTDLGELDRAAQRAAGRNLDPQEWRRFLSDQPYRPTCRELPLPGGELTGSGLGLDLEAAYRATDDLRDLSPGPGDDNFVDIIGEDQGWSLRAPADWQILDITRSGCELRDGEGLLVRLWVMDSLPSGGPESLTDYARQLTGTDVMPIETEVEASGEEESSGTNVVRLQFASSAPSAEALGVVVGEQRTSRATVLAMAAPQESLDTSLPAAAALADTIRLPAVEVATLAPRQAPDESYRLNIPESWVLFDESEAGSVRHAYRTCTGRGMLLLEQAACRSRDLEELEDLLAVALPSLGSRLINLFEVEEQPGLFAGKAEPLDPAPGESAPLSVLVFSTPGEGDWRLVVLQCAADDFEFYSEFFFSIAMSVRWTG